MHRQAQNSPYKSVGTSDNKNLSTPICINCKSEWVIKHGSRKTKKRGLQQQWFCNKCHKSFTINNGFWKMKNNEDKICQAIDTWFEGLSLRKTKRNLAKYSQMQISHQSILRWLQKYSYMITNYAQTVNPQLDGNYYSDETIIRCNKQNHSFGIVMDAKNRYVVSTNYTEYSHIFTEDTIKLWQIAKDVQRPRRLRTDDLQSYTEAFNKVFYTRYNKDKVIWTVINHTKTGKYNYLMERLNNTLKERLKTTRWFKAVWSAKLLLNGLITWYNFIRPHMSFNGKSPADMVGLQKMEWKEMIKEGVKN